MSQIKHQWAGRLLVTLAVLMLGSTLSRADVVIDWNVKLGEFIVDSKLSTPPSNRICAIVHTAMYHAVNAITKRYPGTPAIDAVPGASAEAAIAASNRITLGKLLPDQKAAIDAACDAALEKIADGPSKTAGIAVGEKAAADVLAMRADDGATAEDKYRPTTTAGIYVPTTIPAVTHWPFRKPWLMSSPTQFRPGPPPQLNSEIWARDFNELKELGGKNSTKRTAEQTEIARFWEATLPPIYHGLVRSVAGAPGRDITQNARMFAAVTQAVDDAMIAIFDAKYHYGFWRPITAIRNGDIDGNDATERDQSWTPFIETPMHPEYPCAHCIIAASVGTVLQAELGNSQGVTLMTSSPTANGTTRRWSNIEDFIQEVANARIWDGVHFRTSTEVGTAMGRKVGELAVAKFLR